MKVKQCEIMVYPGGGKMFYIYVGAPAKGYAWMPASQMYPDATVVVRRDV